MKPPALTLTAVLAWLETATPAELQAVKAKCQALQNSRYGAVGEKAVPLKGSSK